jgi:hypothetical protein
MSRRTRRCVDDSRPSRPSARVRSRGHASKLCATVREGVEPRGHAATLMAGTVQTSIPGTSATRRTGSALPRATRPDVDASPRPGSASSMARARGRCIACNDGAWSFPQYRHVIVHRDTAQRDTPAIAMLSIRLPSIRLPSSGAPSTAAPSAGALARASTGTQRWTLPVVVPGTNRAIDQDAVDAIRRDGTLEILAQKIICNPAIPLGMRSSPD